MASTYLCLQYHIVFSTAGRKPWIHAEWRLKLHAYLAGAIRALDGEVPCVGGTDDHIHLLFGLKATHCLSDFMQEIKKASSIWVHETVPLPAFHWQEGYAAITVSPSSLATVRRYIENQEEHHRHRTFREEVLMMLRRAGVEVDERYFD